ncbi:hypothetical protein DL98DRAFT_589372 [Cadophora sp. DSE1049]|nr:hypothetical protein DL98DRAFT_589372 [Cadophora sp. DSE1049]
MSTHYVYIPLSRALIVTSVILTFTALVTSFLITLIANGMGLHVLFVGIAAAAALWVDKLLEMFLLKISLAWAEEARREGRDMGVEGDRDSDEERGHESESD